VLDGQQRLTSLYQAFYGVGEHRYYLDLNLLLRMLILKRLFSTSAPPPNG